MLCAYSDLGLQLFDLAGTGQVVVGEDHGALDLGAGHCRDVGSLHKVGELCTPHEKKTRRGVSSGLRSR